MNRSFAGLNPLTKCRAWLPLAWLCIGSLLSTFSARAHDAYPAYLQLHQTSADTYEVFWRVRTSALNLPREIFELPEDCINIIPVRTEFASEIYTERRLIKRAGGLNGATIRVDGLDDVVVRLVRLDGSAEMIQLTPASPSFKVKGTSGRFDTMVTYLKVGFEHILLGLDHLLFVLGLLLIVSNRWTLVKSITAFTVAHSLTLGAATLGFASAPSPPLEAAIALSILFLGPEIVRTWRGETSLTIRQPWVVAFAFGLLHGFGFASGLSTVGLDGSALIQALLFFNVGVELGQLAFIGLMLAMARFFKMLEMPWPKWVARAPGYAVGVCGAYWTIQRTVMMFAK